PPPEEGGAEREVRHRQRELPAVIAPGLGLIGVDRVHETKRSAGRWTRLLERPAAHAGPPGAPPPLPPDGTMTRPTRPPHARPPPALAPRPAPPPPHRAASPRPGRPPPPAPSFFSRPAPSSST